MQMEPPRSRVFVRMLHVMFVTTGGLASAPIRPRRLEGRIKLPTSLFHVPRSMPGVDVVRPELRAWIRNRAETACYG
jgi:hypothetical protein